ncbi:hypothetical protein EX30DRAFT_366280 [Ascodesmis nigricans]|uniref:Uncharacterized protein n=1 Tax=Ascodesmis nigricans TaxID=341454 RepID=A0A4V6RHB9_9PEZI|nr:hypothetical protein EX30DRAFT_366280 [Ascodesmis nigricans]
MEYTTSIRRRSSPSNNRRSPSAMRNSPRSDPGSINDLPGFANHRPKSKRRPKLPQIPLVWARDETPPDGTAHLSPIMGYESGNLLNPYCGPAACLSPSGSFDSLVSDAASSSDLALIFPRAVQSVPTLTPSIPEPPPPLEFQFYQPESQNRWSSEPPEYQPPISEEKERDPTPVPEPTSQPVHTDYQHDHYQLQVSGYQMEAMHAIPVDCQNWNEGWYMSV